MPQILFNLPIYYEKFKEWVNLNPRQANDVETTLKWTSYFIAGRLRNSHTLSELVYCLSNLLVLHNDRIIVALRQVGRPPDGDVLKLWLTVIEYSEVFLELSAESICGVTGKWFTILFIELFKCICRLFLIYHYKNSITETPSIGPLSRNELLPTTNIKCKNKNYTQLDSVTMTLNRSGKELRKVDASPAPHARSWKALQKSKLQERELKQRLVGIQLAAETVYICKPLCHLGCIGCFSSNTWKPWILSLGLDLISLLLYEQGEKQNNKLRPSERMLISRRYVYLSLYLLRSPFYEGYSKHIIESTLRETGTKVPLIRFIIQPILKYLPFWQSIYFYMWAN